MGSHSIGLAMAERVSLFYDKPAYLPRSCRRARSVHFALADPIESPFERESGLFIPRRRGPLRFTGPVQNHVELVRRRAFIAPDHEDPLAVRRGLVVREAVIVQEEGGPIKKPARRSEGTVRPRRVPRSLTQAAPTGPTPPRN